MITARSWAAWPLIIAAGVVLAEVVSFRALATWLLVSVVATWWVVATLVGSGRRLLALVGGAAVTALATGLTEWLAGTADGPVTRSVLLCAGLTVAMVVLLATRWPLLATVPGLALVVSALAIGGAGNAFTSVGLITVAFAVTATTLGPYRGRDLRDRRHLVPLAAAMTVVGLTTIFVAALAWLPVAGSGATAAASSISDTVTVPTSAQEAATPAAETASSPETTPPTSETSTTPWWMWLLLGVSVAAALLLLLVLLALIAGLTRRAWAAWRWRRLRHRLRQGSAAERIAGAWTWARLRRARYDRGLPPYASPDLVVGLAAQTGEPHLEVLARLATPVAFDPQAATTMPDSGRAWEAADEVGRRPRPASWDERWAWAARGPNAAERQIRPTA